jgi:ribosomal protein S14
MAETTKADWESIERKQGRRVRRCSYCGSELHTIKDCPELLKRGDSNQ